MNIGTLLDLEKLSAYIRTGYISARRHPHLPLEVLNYTPKAQFEGLWDNVTLHCRGLVVDSSGNIVGNCMKKFFNYGEPSAANIATSGPVQVTDKLDGSMGTVSFYKDDLVVATRGSFESEQAIMAYELIKENYLHAFRTLCENNSTAIVEIIYPENRVVVDYGVMKDVVLIGVISNEDLRNGRQLWTPADQVYSWPGPRVRRFDVDSFEAALKLPPRKNAEGIVVYFEDTGDRLKIKQQDYIELHKLVFNLTPRLVWTRLADGDSVAVIAQGLPDEFKKFVEETAAILTEEARKILYQVEAEYAEIIKQLPQGFSRREFAELALQSQLSSLLFSRIEGNYDRMDELAWKMVRP